VEYIYLGDRFTDSTLKKKRCAAGRRNNKCVRGRNGSMLVVFADGEQRVVIGRLLRKIQLKTIAASS
jgi:hypothetical protein